MQALPRNARLFVGFIGSLGLLSLLDALCFPVAARPGPHWEKGIFLALSILAGGAKIRLTPRGSAENIGSLSLLFALTYVTLLRFGPSLAMLVGCLSTLSACFYPKRQRVHQVIFNLGLIAVSTFTAGRVFLWVSGGSFPAELFPLFTTVMASCLAFFLINSLGVASIIALSTGKNLGHIWRDSFLWTAPSYFAAASAGTLAILLLGNQVGAVLLFFTPVAALTHLAYALSQRRAEENQESQQRIQELQTHEAQLAEDLRHEHQIAETLQRSLLSAPAEDAFAGLCVHTEYEPAWKEALVGGDFYDVLALGEGRVAFVVGDVTGKGLAAATHTAEVKFALRAILHEHPEPARALTRLNRFLMQPQPGGPELPLVAVALAVVDARTGEAAVASAGAEYPLLLRAGGGAEALRAGGMLLGTLRDAEYEAQTLRLLPGDSLLLVTDGLTEARGGSQFFGYEGLKWAAQRAQAAGVVRLGQEIIADAKRFTGGALHDDVCLLVVRREPEAARVPSVPLTFSTGGRTVTAAPVPLTTGRQ